MLRIRNDKQGNKVYSKCWVLVQRAEGQVRKKANKGGREIRKSEPPSPSPLGAAENKDSGRTTRSQK